MPLRASAMREVLTAMESSMGSSGGITEVTIREQFNNSLYLLLVGSSRPYINQKLFTGTVSISQGTIQSAMLKIKINTQYSMENSERQYYVQFSLKKFLTQLEFPRCLFLSEK